jgi:2-polyprenyl-3-methyl-5-hydroxy-6-metoxy-1,4-benzoquinol methylase
MFGFPASLLCRECEWIHLSIWYRTDKNAKSYSTAIEKLYADSLLKIKARRNLMERTHRIHKSKNNYVKDDSKNVPLTDVFFDENSEFYNTLKKIYPFDLFFINFIKNQNNFKKSFLDIGGGSGIFSSFLKRNCSEIEVTLIDPSLKMLEKNCDKTFIKYQGQLPDKLNIPHGKKYNFILIKEVLHHVTGKSIKESKAFAIESLQNTKNLMEDDGYLMIHELFYESYIYAPLSRTCIFYLLNLQNAFHFKILPKEFLLGLSACFYTRTELELFFRNCGFVIVKTYKDDWPNNLKTKGLLLKKWGRILYILKKIEVDN